MLFKDSTIQVPGSAGRDITSVQIVRLKSSTKKELLSSSSRPLIAPKSPSADQDGQQDFTSSQAEEPETGPSPQLDQGQSSQFSFGNKKLENQPEGEQIK